MLEMPLKILVHPLIWSFCCFAKDGFQLWEIPDSKAFSLFKMPRKSEGPFALGPPPHFSNPCFLQLPFFYYPFLSPPPTPTPPSLCQLIFRCFCPSKMENQNSFIQHQPAPWREYGLGHLSHSFRGFFSAQPSHCLT